MSLALSVWGIPREPIDATYNEQKELLKQFDFYKKKGKKKSRY
jgi:hypothetical protein